MSNPLHSIRLGLGFIVGSVILATTAWGGYAYDFSYSNPLSKKDKETTATIFVDGGKVKITGMGEGDIVFNGSDSALTLVDHKQKSYFTLDKQSIAEIKEQINSAMAEMEQQLAAMPPAQRKMMEGMLKNKMPKPVEVPTLEVDRTGESQQIAGFEAEKILVESSDGTKQELWVVPWSKMGGAEGIADAFTGMSSLVEDMMGAIAQGPLAGMAQKSSSPDWLSGLEEIGGFPVLAKSYDAAGKLVSESLLSAVEERDLPASEFAAPKKYKQQQVKIP